MTKVVLATRNAGKVRELQRILAQYGLQLEGASYDPGPETGASFEENALAKAREGVSRTGLPSVADDSGLAVDALNGMPGILSARWCGHHGDDQANLELVLAQMADVPVERRGAAFVCAAAYALPDGRSGVVVEQLRGALLTVPRGTNGFGYDPIFVPHGYDVTTAEMTADLKDSISHRGQAFRALAPLLSEALILR